MTQLQTARPTTCTSSTRNVRFFNPRLQQPRYVLNAPSVHHGRALHVSFGGWWAMTASHRCGRVSGFWSRSVLVLWLHHLGLQPASNERNSTAPVSATY